MNIPNCKHEIAYSIRFSPLDSTEEERGIYELDAAGLELRRGSRTVDIRPKAIQALSVLVGSEGRLVTNEELCHVLWGEQQLGWRNNLHQCVRDVRRALNDDARSPRFVETVNRLGYRFIGERVSNGEHDLPNEIVDHPVVNVANCRRLSAAFGAGAFTALAVPVVLVAVIFVLVC